VSALNLFFSKDWIGDIGDLTLQSLEPVCSDKEMAMYKIGDFSKLSQIPVKTLRYYDEIGLLRPGRIKHSSGYRCYRAEHFERLNRILVLKDLGFSLPEIRGLLAERVPPQQIREILRRKRDEMERHVYQESARLARAEARLDLLERGGTTTVHDVAVRTTGAWLVASVRDTIRTHEECERLFEELDRHTNGHRGRCQRGAVWHDCNGAIDCEAFELLPDPIERKGRLQVHEMPPCRVASLIYRGDKDYMSAYHAIRSWIAASGIVIAGPKREIYLDNDNEDGESVTEIQFPVVDDIDSVH
jgi:DNA-binding transcriptional MerR regulator